MGNRKRKSDAEWIKQFRRDDPFRLDPEKLYTLNVSGGRTSAFMFRKILDRYDGRLPANCVAVFANTGKEHTATYDFVHRMEIEWEVPVVWVEFYRDETARGVKGAPKNTYRVVNFETAARQGEPFMEAVRVQDCVPTIYKRFCTSRLKVWPIDLYVRMELGWKRKHIVNVLGIRADEPRRFLKADVENDCRIAYPLVWAGVGEREILSFWREYDFDLGIDGYLGNCDLCFLKGRGKLLKILRAEPWRAQWWMEAEKKRGTRRKGFREDGFYSDLLAEAQSDMFPETKYEDDSIDCFCGD